MTPEEKKMEFYHQLCGAKDRLQLAMSSLRDEDGRSPTRELALAATKIEEARMWIDEHIVKNYPSGC